MYLATPPMENLINRCKIDEWDPLLREDKFSDIREWLEKQGYQRKPTITRLKYISKYLYKAERRNALFSVFPSSIILSFRGELTFIPDSWGADHGYLELQASDTFYIVDGQHRFGGLKYAIIDDKIEELLSFQVPITILECKSKIDEIKQEQKAEKILEFVAKDANLDVEKLFDDITSSISKKYASLYEFFQQIVTDSNAIKDAGIDPNTANKLEDAIKSRIKETTG